MSSLRLPLLLVLTAVFLGVFAQKEARFKTCKRNQPAAQLNECVRDAIQRAVPELVKGLPDYGLLTIDPLRVESLEVTKSEKSAVSVDISFKDLDIIGLRNAKIKNATIDVNKYLLKTEIHIDGNIMLQGHYTVDGKVLVLPIKGAGPCNITLVNPKGQITEMQAKPVVRNGKEYAHVTTVKFVVTSVDRVYYDLQNLFNGNKELGDNMNLVLNDNWQEIFKDMKSPVQRALGVAFQNIANRVANKVPFKSFFV